MYRIVKDMKGSNEIFGYTYLLFMGETVYHVRDIEAWEVTIGHRVSREI